MLFEVFIREPKIVHKVQGFHHGVLTFLDILEDQLQDKLHVIVLDFHAACLGMMTHNFLQLSY